jgi:CRP-like cAMP-binding protein
MTGESIRRLPDNVIVPGYGFYGLLSDEDRADLISAARSRTFPSGGVLCTQGEPTTHVFILQSGWVKIITVTHEGREVLEALRGGGEVVGEIAGQLTGYRTATVQAIGMVRALLIGAESFGAFLDVHPLAAQAYRQAMAEVQHVAYEKQRSRAMLSGAQRLAGLLLDLTEQPGQVNWGTSATALLLSQEELASLIGASRATVTRALQVWRSRHIIGTDPRHIEILDRARLLQIARRDSKNPLQAHASPLPWRIVRMNADHWPRENSSMAPDGLRESRTSSDCPSRAISTQLPEPPLALLLRQTGAERRLCRLGI